MATAGPSAGEKRPASPEVQDHTPKRVKIEEPATETPAESSESKVSNSKSRGNRGRRGRHSNNNQRGGGRSNNKDPQSGGGTYGERSKGGKEDEKKEPRLPKRKVALLMGYQGTGMYGSQM